MKNWYLYLIIALLTALGGLYFYKEYEIAKLKKANTELIKNNVKRVTEEIIKSYVLTLDRYQFKIDSLKDVSKEVKYIPYEKKYYYDRNVDTALFIIAGYNYDTGPAEKSK
jgi:hypothetical protein